jgi:hypothetical protein
MTAGHLDSGLEDKILRTAISFVHWWGLCTIQSVLGRLEVVSSIAVDPTAARRALERCPSLRWLDDRRDWFSMTAVPNKFAADLRQLFALANPLSFNELHHHLLRSRRGTRQLPSDVLRRYLQAIAGATLLGDVAALPRQEVLSLDPLEAALVRTLVEAGGELDRKELIERAISEPRAARRASRLLQRSLLIIPSDRRRVHVFGHARLVRKTGGLLGAADVRSAVPVT